MTSSGSSRKSPSYSRAELPPEQRVMKRVTPTVIHFEEVRRREEAERQKIARNYARLREQQSGRGSLLTFVDYFWHVLEPPKREMIRGWPLEAIALHLEAITFGDIKRLLINVPPGFMKSLMLNVFWPAWEWLLLARPRAAQTPAGPGLAARGDCAPPRGEPPRVCRRRCGLSHAASFCSLIMA